jgi:uncharacterized protein with HEPN domain
VELSQLRAAQSRWLLQDPRIDAVIRNLEFIGEAAKQILDSIY